MQLRDSVVVVTGASSGIGAATARVLAYNGAIVVLAARRASEIEQLQAEIQRNGGRALAIPTDVGVRADIDHLVQHTIDTYGRIDVLVNNAGVGGGSSIMDRDERLEQMVLINLLAPARLVQAVIPHMRARQRGLIINIGSVAGEVGVSGLYSATKFGVRGLSDALRRELRSDQIDVVLIEPGFIKTPMTEGVKYPMPGPEVIVRAVLRAIVRPRRRIIAPWYYAPMVTFAKLFPGIVDRIIGSSSVQRSYRRRQKTV